MVLFLLVWVLGVFDRIEVTWTCVGLGCLAGRCCRRASATQCALAGWLAGSGFVHLLMKNRYYLPWWCGLVLCSHFALETLISRRRCGGEEAEAEGCFRLGEEVVPSGFDLGEGASERLAYEY